MQYLVILKMLLLALAGLVLIASCTHNAEPTREKEDEPPRARFLIDLEGKEDTVD